jgi:hypothetical protein
MSNDEIEKKNSNFKKWPKKEPKLNLANFWNPW